MGPSHYDANAPWNNILSKVEMSHGIANALAIHTIDGSTDKIREIWTIARTYGKAILQQFVWRSFLVNGLFIGRREDESITIEKCNVRSIDRVSAGQFIAGCVLLVSRGGKNRRAYVNYDCTEAGSVSLVIVDLESGNILPGTPTITGIMADESIGPVKEIGFIIPESN